MKTTVGLRKHPQPRKPPELALWYYRHPATAVISSRASGNVSNLPIAASSPSTLASDSGRTALRAQSRNLASRPFWLRRPTPT
jgi:hypothetical protein